MDRKRSSRAIQCRPPFLHGCCCCCCCCCRASLCLCQHYKNNNNMNNTLGWSVLIGLAKKVSKPSRGGMDRKPLTRATQRRPPLYGVSACALPAPSPSALWSAVVFTRKGRVYSFDPSGKEASVSGREGINRKRSLRAIQRRPRLGFPFCVLRFTFCVLRFTSYVFRFPFYVLRITFYVAPVAAAAKRSDCPWLCSTHTHTHSRFNTNALFQPQHSATTTPPRRPPCTWKRRRKKYTRPHFCFFRCFLLRFFQ